MTSSKIKIKNEVSYWHEKLFNYSFRRKNKLKKIESFLNNTHHLSILEISAGDAVISSILRGKNNQWETIAINESAAKSLSGHLKLKVEEVKNNILPYPDGHFDLLVIIDSLKNITDDYAFVQECHRVINTNGSVVISERRRHLLSFVTLLQHIFKTAPDNTGCIRNGYTPDQIYRILKDGFDVPEALYYSNAFLEVIAVFNDIFQRTFCTTPVWMQSNNYTKEDLYRFRSLYNFARFTYVFNWIGSLFNFLPKHEMIIKSRRRRWSPRRQPKLVDGRSIAEAAINTRIGSAAPF